LVKEYLFPRQLLQFEELLHPFYDLIPTLVH